MASLLAWIGPARAEAGHASTIEVDWTLGARPTPQALGKLAATLEHYKQREVQLRIADQPVTDTPSNRDELNALAERAIDTDPATGRLMWVLYVRRSEPLYGAGYSGMADTVVLTKRGTSTSVPVIVVFTDELERDAMLWITRAKVERATLIHELGHHLGLVGNPAHAQAGDPDHCANAGCVMNRPGAAATFRNALPALVGKIPTTFCKQCREDLERGQVSHSNIVGM